MKYSIPEITVTSILIVLVALLWNPYWMPMGMLMVALLVFVLLVGGFAVFIWREKGGDERDVLIRQVTSRIAYLIVTLVLTIGIVYQMVTIHSVDRWLFSAFVVAVIAKTVGYVYARIKY